MIWLVGRRHRAALLLAAALLVGTAVVVVVARVVIESRAAALAVPTCLTDRTQRCYDGAAQPMYAAFREPYRAIRVWLWAYPPLLGLVVGAGMLAREVEQRTVLLVATQSISRLRWWTQTVLAVLLPLSGVLAVTALATWALAPYATLYRQDRIGTLDFDVQGIWPAVAALLAFAFATVFGTVLRSGMAVVVATVVAWSILYTVLSGSRYELLPDSVAAVPATSYTGEFDIEGLPQDLVFVGPDGRALDQAAGTRMCSSSTDSPGCAAVAEVQLWYQPSSHFWPLQVLTGGLASVVAVLLMVISAMRWRRVV